MHPAAESGWHRVETLRQDAEFVLSRCIAERDSDAVLKLAAASEQPPPRAFERLKHEYSLREQLEPAWAAKPRALVDEHGRAVLLLEDPGGELLSGLLGQPWKVMQFIRVATGMAAALARVHERGLIHKDVKPANILVNTTTGAAWLTGFGIASRLPREHRVPEPPEVIAGTLAYMAPEQTGRMNRSVDSRSDLYALGVTFYELLTGALPFTASKPMEWIHCHIARKPVSPDERVAGIPGPLSAIVMKLLAKTAEERYQTAAGIEADLRRCLAEWEAYGRIDPFALGAHDASDRLLIPERLYGREREIEALLAAFGRVVANGTPELVLVSGYSGIGKSSVVNELHKVLVAPRGLFASGKFDQYKRDIPYATLAQAFQSLVRSLLGQSEAKLGRWRDALREALGPNGQLIVNLVPELELVIGTQPPVPDLPPQDSQNRFQMVFRRFLGVFARKEHPLALFLDDLQWLDSATLELLNHLVTHPDVRHLFLIAAYRDNEVDPAHPLVRTLEAIREAGGRVEQIILAPLALDDVGRLIADALHCEPQRAQPLAQLLQEKTGGNPFFAIQFFTALAEEGLLAFDPVTPAWAWDIDRIRAESYTDNVVDLIAGNLKRFSTITQEALKQLACLGNVAEVTTLALVHGKTEEAMHAALWEAVHAGLVLYQDRAYQFLHDRIQQAAYSLIPEEQRGEVHLALGRVLLASLTADQLTEQLFDVANQLNRGAALLIDRDEKAQVAMIELRAGRKAKASTAYGSARAYFAAGMALLDESGWSRQYELTFNLWLERAECEFLTGNFDTAEQLIGVLLQRAASKVDQAAAHHLKMQLHIVRGEHPQAVASALTCLHGFSIDLPAHPTWEQIQAESETVWRNLDRRAIESLIDLPPMSDPELRAAMDMLSALIPPTEFTDFHLYCLLVCRMVNVSMQHGMSGASAHAYASLGVLLGPVFHRYSEGYRFAKLARDLVEKHNFIAYQARVHHPMGLAAFWTQPIATAIDFTRAAFRSATETGDLTFACYSMSQAVTALLLRNDPLDTVWRESERGLDFARNARYGDVVDIIVSQQRFIATMRGQTATFSIFSDAQFDEATFEAQLTGDRLPRMICWYWILKLKARFLAGDHAEALAAADKAKALLWASPAHIQLLDYFYYTALTVAALYEDASADEQVGWRDLLKAHREQLREWADNYPPTFADKHALVSAEIARLEGRDSDAMRLYEQAIQSAREHGFVQNEGLAHEVAARFYAVRGFDTIANAYLRNARYCYLRWGAEGKVRQLERLHPQLFDEPAPLRLTTTMEARQEQLDLATVVKMSQTLSGEIVLDKLIETLMVTAVEHAGAERGLLVLERGAEQRIEAEATTGRDKIMVRLLDTPAAPAELPDSVLQYVTRTQESVILDDASAHNPFLADEYIRRKHARSILCLPLVKQTELIGVLYLENNLASHVFTPARISVLKLLSSQAAISLQNARLYTELQQENSERRRSEAALKGSEERYMLAVDAAGDGHADWIVATDEFYASPRLLEMCGLPADTKFSGLADFRAQFPLHPEDRDRFLETIDAYYAGRSVRLEIEMRVLRHGETRWMHVTLMCLRDASGALLRVSTANTDITERKRTEEELRSRQEMLDLAQKSAGAVPWEWRYGVDPARNRWSSELESMFGVPAGSFDGTSAGWRKLLHPDDWPTVKASLKRAHETGEIDVEYRVLQADGSVRWLHQKGRTFMGGDGEPVRSIGSMFDVTQKHQAEEELRRMERQLRQAQRLEAMGTLAGGIAHDFNNILSAILGYGEMASRDAPKGSRLRRDLDSIMTAGERGRALVDRILAFSRSSVHERVAVHVERVAREALDQLAAKLPADVTIAPRLRAGRAAVLGDPTQVHQVLMNLSTNAIQAMPSGGTLRVLLKAVRLDAPHVATTGAVEAGDYVVLEVSDSGVGIAPDVLERIFDPFFTTKEVGVGTGLGLSLVHGIVTELGGAINVASALGAGSTFTVYLPRAGDAIEVGEIETPDMPRGNHERVLVVDDEEPLVRIATETLEELGYRPVGFTSSSAALEAFRADPLGFDAVITDERMPGMSGSTLIREVHAIRAGIPTMLMSGFTGGTVSSRAREAGADEVLKKPLTGRELATSLARVLHA